MAGLQTESQFPAGLRVLVVDDDTTCLRILDRMLRRLLYHVTICSQATVALDILRERKGCFDLVLSDVHMPDMDGYKLLEQVGLEMDLPVIMMSGDGRTSAVMRGIRHGACDYLIKPVREEELKNIWQHVVRKKWNENKEVEQSGILEDNDGHRRRNDDAENASSINDGSDGSLRHQKRKSSVREEDEDEVENEDLDPTASKKPRVVWSVELHQQFVSAVNQLGIDKAVPKRILELMNMPGLTRENVASHLQKFRLYLKRLSGVAPQGAVSNAFYGSVESNAKFGTLGRYDIQALAASGQIHPQTLAALLGRSVGNLVPAVEQPALLPASFQGPKCIPVEHAAAFGQPLVKCQSDNISKHFQQSIISAEDLPSGFGVLPPDANLGSLGGSNVGRLNSQNNNLLVDMHQRQSQRQQKQLPESNRTINVQPSCLVVPSLSSNSFGTMNSPASVNQNISFNKGGIFDYSLPSPRSNNSSLNLRQISEGDPKPADVLSGYPALGPLSPCTSACSLTADNNSCSLQIPNSIMVFKASRQPLGLAPNVCSAPGSYSATKPTEVIDQITNKNLGFTRQGASIPTRFAIDEFESSMNNMSNGKTFAVNNGEGIKQETDADFTDSIKVGTPVLHQFPSIDLTSVFTK